MALVDVTSEPLPQLAPRRVDSHKGDFGRVLIVGGSRGMAGAPALAGMAALRSGAGLVTLAVPASVQPTVAKFEPSYMTIACGNDTDAAFGSGHLDQLLAATAPMTAVALGPGLGTADSTVELVQALYRELPVPLVVDADGLNALARETRLLKAPPAARILTPHPGEFARLFGKPCGTDTESRAEHAALLARRDDTGSTTVVLKGHHSIVTDGSRFAVNSTGNPGMATGGTGDCLTGMIVALLGQHLSPWKATRLGVHLHGLAGDLAVKDVGEASLIASDLARYLPEAFQAHARS